MMLTKVERERVNDSRLKLQSVANSLKKVNPNAIPDFAEIESCLEDADRNLTVAIRASESNASTLKPERDNPE